MFLLLFSNNFLMHRNETDINFLMGFLSLDVYVKFVA